MEINSANLLSSQPPANSAANGAVGKDDFLMLLVAQMSHQDPLNPMENGEFVAQLAQFTSLEQLMSIRESSEATAEILSRLAEDKRNE